MDYRKVNAIGICVIALSTFLGVLAAIIFYLYQIKEVFIIEVIAWATFNIDLNLIFIYILRGVEVL